MRQGYRRLADHRTVRPVVAGLLAVAVLLCLVHGLDEDDHAITHAVCGPAVALVSAVVALWIARSTGWLLTSVLVVATAPSLYLADPPPEPFARS